jgi:hypothetical protein
MARYVTGTIAQLVGKLTLNGVALGQLELSTMTRIFAGSTFKQVGQIKREGERGRPAIIWQIDTETAAWFEVGTVSDGLTVSDTEAVAAPLANVA